METRRLSCLQHNIESLGANEHTVLLEMLTHSGVRCASNSNGHFCDLAALPDALVERIAGFVSFSLDNNESLKVHDRCMHDQLQLLQRVPSAASADVAAPPAGRWPAAGAAPASAAPRGGARMAFVKRAVDAASRRRVDAGALLELEAPVLLHAAAPG